MYFVFEVVHNNQFLTICIKNQISLYTKLLKLCNSLGNNIKTKKKHYKTRKKEEGKNTPPPPKKKNTSNNQKIFYYLTSKCKVPNLLENLVFFFSNRLTDKAGNCWKEVTFSYMYLDIFIQMHHVSLKNYVLLTV